MEQQTQKRIKFNVVDAGILAVIVLAAAFFLWRYVLAPKSAEEAEKGVLYNYTMTLDNIELPNDSFEGKIAVGDTVKDKVTGMNMGTIADIRTEPSRSYAVNEVGEIVIAPRPLHSRLILTVVGVGQFPVGGGLLVDGQTVYNNSGYAAYVGNSALSLRVVLIEQGPEASENGNA